VIIRKKFTRFQYNENIINIQTTQKMGKDDRETEQLKKKIEMLESELKMVNNTCTQYDSKYKLQEKQMSEKQTQLERALQENSDLEKTLRKTQSEKKNILSEARIVREKREDKCVVIDILNKNVEIQIREKT
jgi:chromosome segregation ATPase